MKTDFNILSKGNDANASGKGTGNFSGMLKNK